jgi:hypothetical protein
MSIVDEIKSDPWFIAKIKDPELIEEVGDLLAKVVELSVDNTKLKDRIATLEGEIRRLNDEREIQGLLFPENHVDSTRTEDEEYQYQLRGDETEEELIEGIRHSGPIVLERYVN